MLTYLFFGQFAGTNIGTTILLSRVVQEWQEIERRGDDTGISDRNFWATVYVTDPPSLSILTCCVKIN